MAAKRVANGICGAFVNSKGTIVDAASFVPVGKAAADHQLQQAIARITELLEQLNDQKLDDERSELDGCRDAIDKATAIRLDQGKLGVSLGLDSAVHAIGKALAAADRRLTKWKNALDELPKARLPRSTR